MIKVMLAHVGTAKRLGKKNWSEGICALRVFKVPGMFSGASRTSASIACLTGSLARTLCIPVVMSILSFQFTLLEMNNLFGFEC